MKTSHWTVWAVLCALIALGLRSPSPALAGDMITCGSSPACDTGCQPGFRCTTMGTACQCVAVECEASAPACDGLGCQRGERCRPVGQACECQPVACGDSAPTCDGGCPVGQRCASTGQACECQDLGCCEFDAGKDCINTTQAQCTGGKTQPTFKPDAVCINTTDCVDNTPTGTVTSTATATRTATSTRTGTVTSTPTLTGTSTTTPTITPTRTPVPNGGSCATPAECQSLNCINGICEPPNSPAPAASPTGLAIGIGILIALGALGLWRMRRAAGVSVVLGPRGGRPPPSPRARGPRAGRPPAHAAAAGRDVC